MVGEHVERKGQNGGARGDAGDSDY